VKRQQLTRSPGKGKPSVLQIAVARGGVMKGPRVCSFVIAWARVANELGREPTVAEYIRRSGTPERSAWRELREFREIFVELGPKATPQVFVEAVRAQSDDLDAENLALMGQVPADGLTAAR
jgi:hypothetical protein